MAKKPAAKVAAAQTPEEEGLSRNQKILLGGVATFIPFFLVIILPLLTRNYVLKTFNLQPEVLLASPLTLKMAPSGAPIPTLRLVMKGMAFQVPRIFTPVRITPTLLTFRNNPRRISRTISVSIIPEPPRIDLRHSGALSWFLPEATRDFLQLVLWATWHPVRVYAKAQFLVNQGIGSSFFRTDWDAAHEGFVFPTPANSGYIARIFAGEHDPYIEFSMFDETDPVNLETWTDVAITLKPPLPGAASPTPVASRPLSLASSIALTANEETAHQVLQDFLNQFYLTGNPSWLLPVGLIMEHRMFFREAIALCKQAIPQLAERPQEVALWRDLFDRAVKQVVKVDVDPHLELDQVNVYVKNLTKFPLRRIKLHITAADAAGERTFSATVQEVGAMQAEDEKVFPVPTSPGFLSRKLQGMSWTVEDIEIGE